MWEEQKVLFKPTLACGARTIAIKVSPKNSSVFYAIDRRNQMSGFAA